MSNNHQPKNKEKEEVEIQQPTPSGFGRRRHSFEKTNAKLDHSRTKLFGWMFSYLKRNKIIFILCTILLISGTIIFSISPLLSKNIIDIGIIGNNAQYFLDMCLIYSILLIFYILSNFIGSYGMGRISQKIIFNIRNDIFSQLQDMSMNYFDKRSSGDIISIATNDVDQLSQLISNQIVVIINSVITVILTIIFMYILNPILASLSLIMIPGFLIMMLLFRKVATGAFKDTRRSISKVTSSIQENISGVKVVQAFGKEKKVAAEFEKANRANYDAGFKARRIFSTFFPLIQLITSLITVGILLVGVFMAIYGINIFGLSVSVGVLTAFITYLSQFFRPFMMLMQIQIILESAFAASDRIYSLLEEKVKILDSENPKSIDEISGSEVEFIDVNFLYSLNSKDNGEKPNQINKDQIPMISGKNFPKNPDIILNMAKTLEKMLENQTKLQQSGDTSGEMSGGRGIHNLSPQNLAESLAVMEISSEVFNKFSNLVKEAILEQRKLISYKSSKGFVLKEINLKISAGTTLAIVGETGAGKTTMIKLISRFYDVNNGQITIDGTNICDIKKDELRKMIGLVPQDSFIFTGTIRENLQYAIDNPNEEIEQKMIEVSKFLGLHNFIVALPNKYETKLIENGSNISIGQRQLIAFARALITDPKILILDEATSSVDPYTETLIQDALDKARKGRTTIIIAHRLSTIKNADHIIVLDKETHNIVEEGNHQELLELNGKYKKLIQMQHKDIQIEGY